ncbi:hypothetical protein GUJ93_ZPchr0014g47612 [Zizania palustris]|uniref:Uncharacterized protein n=1 Tax=Zizania palustris TaxID=103762 RepID=A0A8J5TCF1_ZIZPA|nr:hypothetical protein GUJ93_ZPchr0014g47612 [Zizania palustris]
MPEQGQDGGRRDFRQADRGDTNDLPSVSKLSPGQAAYHFLAGYHDGKFVPAYIKGPSPVDPLDLANSLFSHYVTVPRTRDSWHSAVDYWDHEEMSELHMVSLRNWCAVVPLAMAYASPYLGHLHPQPNKQWTPLQLKNMKHHDTFCLR